MVVDVVVPPDWKEYYVSQLLLALPIAEKSRVCERKCAVLEGNDLPRTPSSEASLPSPALSLKAIEYKPCLASLSMAIRVRTIVWIDLRKSAARLLPSHLTRGSSTVDVAGQFMYRLIRALIVVIAYRNGLFVGSV